MSLVLQVFVAHGGTTYDNELAPQLTCKPLLAGLMGQIRQKGAKRLNSNSSTSTTTTDINCKIRRNQKKYSGGENTDNTRFDSQSKESKAEENFHSFSNESGGISSRLNSSY